MKVERKDAVVVGAGQAGLAASFYLKQAGVEHAVLERGEIGESWRSQRWDSFCLNTPNWSNKLPGKTLGEYSPGAFSHRDKLVEFFETYVRDNDLPVRERTPVTGIYRDTEGRFMVKTGEIAYRTSSVIIASGTMNRPRIPKVSRKLPSNVLSTSAGNYRNPESLPEGAVLVVGSGQSGCQITEELLKSGRKVYLCVSNVARAPRRYRGRDILGWWKEMGFLDASVEDLEDKSIILAAQPQVSGTEGGHTISLQSLSRDGAVLLGRLEDIDGSRVGIGSNLMSAIEFADSKSAFFKASIDKFIEEQHIVAPLPAPDPNEPELGDLNGSDSIRQLDLEEAGIGSVIWCTGFDADWSWIRVNIFDGEGRPAHNKGVTRVKGFYFLGSPWLSKRKSGIIYGVAEDAERIVNKIVSEREPASIYRNRLIAEQLLSPDLT